MAVAITLLVLDLKLPEGLSDHRSLRRHPGLGAYHVVLRSQLSRHRPSLDGAPRPVAHMWRVDGALMWLDLFFLMAVALIPFTHQRHEQCQGRTADDDVCGGPDGGGAAAGRDLGLRLPPPGADLRRRYPGHAPARRDRSAAGLSRIRPFDRRCVCTGAAAANGRGCWQPSPGRSYRLSRI